MASQWDTLTTDFNSGMWMLPYCQRPFWDAHFKRLVVEQSGAPWKVLDVGCGMGQHTIKLLQAGASYVLAFDISKDMVEGAKLETRKFLQTEALPESKVDFVVASATDCSSIPGAQEGKFDLAICIYVLCNLLSKEEVKRALTEIYKMLKPGGKLMICETHVIQYVQWDDESAVPLLYKWCAPKEDGTKWGYFEDEGKPREVRMRMNSGQGHQPVIHVVVMGVFDTGRRFSDHSVFRTSCGPRGHSSRCTGLYEVCCRKTSGNVLGVH